MMVHVVYIMSYGFYNEWFLTPPVLDVSIILFDYIDTIRGMEMLNSLSSNGIKWPI